MFLVLLFSYFFRLSNLQKIYIYMKRIGIIDLGSNTTRLIVMGYEPYRCFKLFDEVSETVRLAEGIGDSGLLQPRAMYRAVETLKLFHTLCQATQVQPVVAVGTSALRDAKNQVEFVRMLKQEAGLDMRVLSGKEEAYYGYLGVINSLSLTDGFVIDIGGGSTEVTEVYHRSFNRWASRPVGTVRFTERYIQSDPISSKDFRALKQGAVDAFQDITWLQSAPGRVLVGIGGTVRNLARIDQKRRNYPLERLHGYVLTYKALDSIVTMLRKESLAGREAIPGLNRDRADVILAGAVILQHLMTQGNFEEILIGGQGLREGVFYEHFLQPQQTPVFADVRGFSVQNLAYLCEYEASHATKVRELSLSLFDQLAPLHGYGAWERELLGYAGILHDIGMHISYYDHHKHSEYLVVNAALGGFTHREIAMLALLVRAHRRGSVAVEHYRMVLGDGDEERVMRLGALLRLAEYMEESKNQVVRDLRVEFNNGLVRVHLHTQGDATVELWNVNRQTKLFTRAFGRELEVVDGG